MKRAAHLLLLSLALAACGKEAAVPTEEGGEASGEVLAGSISDAMIPLEQLESQAPLAPRQAQAVGGDVDAEQPEVTPAPGIEGGPVEPPAPVPAPAAPEAAPAG